VVAVGFVAELNPLDRDLELSALVFAFNYRDVSRLSERVDAWAPVDEEV